MSQACRVGGREAAFELNEVDRRRLAGQRRVDAAGAPDTGGARTGAGSDATTVVAKRPGSSHNTESERRGALTEGPGTTGEPPDRRWRPPPHQAPERSRTAKRTSFRRAW